MEPNLPPDLHDAASFGRPIEDVDHLIRAAADVDEAWWGRTALFEAVMYRRPEIARRLVAAGADPWRPQMNGWSPGRLALAGPEPDLFGPPPAAARLTGDEREAVSRSRRLIAALADLDLDGASIACVADVSAADAAGRLRAQPVEIAGFDEWQADPWSTMPGDELDRTMGATDVPGGCVLTQWVGFAPSTPGVMALLTAGTTGYGMFGNPKSGNQGRHFRDGVMLGWDLHPGGGETGPDDPADEILRTFLYLDHAVAYCCDAAALTPADRRPFTGPPDIMLRIPPATNGKPHPGPGA